jgi:hypothetical protein
LKEELKVRVIVLVFFQVVDTTTIKEVMHIQDKEMERELELKLEKFKGCFKLYGMQGHKSPDCQTRKQKCKSSIKWDYTGSKKLHWKVF